MNETDIVLLDNIIYENQSTHTDEFNILLVSSLFFITNIATAFFNEYYLYSGLFCFLTISSLIYHSNNNIYTKIIDKIAIASIILYGSYILYNKINLNNLFNSAIIISAFLLCIYFYNYGFINKQYCFCDDLCVAQKYHFIMHIIVSIGHHLIIFL